jgi:hypothetical protein
VPPATKRINELFQSRIKIYTDKYLIGKSGCAVNAVEKSNYNEKRKKNKMAAL